MAIRASFSRTVVVCVALALLGSSCSAKSDASGGGPTRSGSALVSSAKRDLEALYKGTYGAPPTTGPKAVRGKNVWYISLGVNGVEDAIQAAKDAAKSLGWKLTVFDGKFDTNTQQAGIRQALAAGADGIITYGFDCTPVQGALQDAKKAGVPVVGVDGVDCDPPLYTATLTYEPGDYLAFYRALGAAQATWLLADSGGVATVLYLEQDDLTPTKVYGEGFAGGLKDCAGCTVVTLKYQSADLGPGLQAMIQQALIKNPKIDYLETSYDAVVTISIDPALKAAGRLQDIKVLGGEGRPDNADLVRSGEGQAMGVGIPFGWDPYAGMDALNRIFAHAEQANSGEGAQVFDAKHNLPKTGGYVAPVDYVAAYEKVWAGQ